MITIPVDAYLVTVRVVTNRVVERTIQVGRTTQTRRERVEELRETTPGFTPENLRALFAMANRIWTPATITFQLRSTTPRSLRAPSNTDNLTDDDFRALARRDFAPRNGVSALFVRNFSGADGGGGALEPFCACILRALNLETGRLNEPLMGSILAHEFGHLLHLDHNSAGARDLGNLMREGARPPDSNALTAEQIHIAQGSSLAHRFQTAAAG